MPRFDESGATRKEESIGTLASDPNAAIFDHEFMSPTYRQVLWQHITNYIESQGKIL